MNKKNRDVNLDILRIIAMIAVILLHVGSLYGKDINSNYPTYYFTIGNFLHTVTRFSVPIFVLLSGCFILSDDRNMEYKKFYKKIIKRIIIPVVLVSFLYVIYSIILGELHSKMTSVEYSLSTALIAWIKGSPFYHMWYVYMTIGMYFFTPFIIKVRVKLGDDNFFRLGIIILIVNLVVNFKGLNLIWPIQFIEFLGYFILGYSLKKKQVKKVNCKKYIFVGGAISLLVFIIVEVGVRFNLNFNYMYFMQPKSITMALSSILIYMGFLGLNQLKIDTKGLEKHTFNIYLLHAGVLSIFDLGFRNLILEYPNPILYFPLMFMVGFLVSYFISKIILNLVLSVKVKKKCL